MIFNLQADLYSINCLCNISFEFLYLISAYQTLVKHLFVGLKTQKSLRGIN